MRLEIEPLLDSPQMAHVHRTTCAKYAKIKGIDKQILTVHSPLADVRDGEKSESTVPGSIATGEFSINVHEPASPFPAVACGAPRVRARLSLPGFGFNQGIAMGYMLVGTG